MKSISSKLKTIKMPSVNLGKDSYLAMVLAFFLGRTVLAGSLAPFGPAFYAGLCPLGGILPIFAAVATMLGSVTLGHWDITAYHALAILLVTLIVRPAEESRFNGFVDAVITGSTIAVSRVVVSVIRNLSLFAYLSSLLEGLCGVIVSFLARIIFDSRRAQNPVAREKASEALLVTILLSIGGLQGVSILGLRIEAIIAMACTLVAGYLSGPGAGAIAGLGGGLILTLADPENPAILGVLGVSGLLAGIGGWFGKVESVIAFMSGGLIASLYVGDGPLLTERLVEQLLSCSPIFALTPSVTKWILDRFPVLTPAKSKERSSLNPDSNALRSAAVAHALLGIGDMLAEAAASSAVPYAASGTPSEEEAASPGIGEGSSQCLRQVAERVCWECPSKNYCWEDNFGDTYEAFSDLTRTMQVIGQISSDADVTALKDRCRKFDQVVAELQHFKELERLERAISSMDGETKSCLSHQYRCLGNLLAPKGAAIQSETSRPRTPKMKFTFKGNTLPAQGSAKAGDMWVRYELSGGRELVVLVDGMGKGERAARQSRETVSILKSLLDCGLDYDSSVSFLNSALFLSCRPDSFVAVDCLLLDQVTERAYFHKLGAPPSFIRKADGNVLVVRGSRPPAGVLNVVPTFATSEPISPGDEIYLVSDGAFRSTPVPARAEHLIMSKIRRFNDGPLEANVRALLSFGLKFRNAEPPDDVTVVGIKVDPA